LHNLVYATINCEARFLAERSQIVQFFQWLLKGEQKKRNEKWYRWGSGLRRRASWESSSS
jgi:hypothetical protein